MWTWFPQHSWVILEIFWTILFNMLYVLPSTLFQYSPANWDPVSLFRLDSKNTICIIFSNFNPFSQPHPYFLPRSVILTCDSCHVQSFPPVILATLSHSQPNFLPRSVIPTSNSCHVQSFPTKLLATFSHPHPYFLPRSVIPTCNSCHVQSFPTKLLATFSHPHPYFLPRSVIPTRTSCHVHLILWQVKISL
jgi:hypothetical protein